MQLSDGCNNSTGHRSGQNLTKKSLEGGSVTTSSRNTTYPATSYKPSVRHGFKAHQTKPKVTGHVAKQFSSQVRPGGFLTRMTISQGRADSQCKRKEQLKVDSSMNSFENQTLISPGHAKAGVKHFTLIKKRVGTNCLFL